jgi:hypothetical protein
MGTWPRPLDSSKVSPACQMKVIPSDISKSHGSGDVRNSVPRKCHEDPSDNFGSSDTKAKTPCEQRERLGGPGRIRTCDARFRKPTLYPLSYGAGGVCKT